MFKKYNFFLEINLLFLYFRKIKKFVLTMDCGPVDNVILLADSYKVSYILNFYITYFLTIE